MPLLMVLFLMDCVYGERVEMADANLMVLVAVAYKESKCGQRPPEFLFVIINPTKFAVDACVFSLISEPCPFTAYPLICLELYDIDIPGIGPNLDEYPPDDNDQNILESFSKTLTEI